MSNFWSEDYSFFYYNNISYYVSNWHEQTVNGYINIGRTIFICILLAIGALYFSRDADNLVLIPIEWMIEKIKIIAIDPLAAANGDFESAGVLSL